MMSSANASSWLPWIWALEALASNHADTSLLIDLVKKIPHDVLENDGKNPKELAFLRILECLSVFRKGKCSDGSSRPECDGVGFTPLNGCEDGLRQILLKSLRPDHELSEPEMSKWDIDTFVQNKRPCLPKCTLKQLKDVILKDSHLLPSSLMERSGLLINNPSDGITKRLPEGSNSDAPENSKVRDLNYVKRVGDDSATANQGVPSACKQMIMYNAATKRKGDSLAKVNETKQQLCIICKIGGQLLVCSSGACRRVVHERCLAVAPTFDAKRRFYCPICAYSRAVSEYSDSKKQLSLAKKALLSFISRDEYRLRNSDVLGREHQNHLREIEVSVKCIEQNNLENFASRLNPARSMIHMKENSPVSWDLSSGEGERVVTGEENMVDKQNAESQSIREQVQQVPELDVQNCKAYISLHGRSKQLAVVEKLQEEVLQQPNGVILVRNNEKSKIASRGVQDSKVHNSNCKDLEIARGSEPPTGGRREQGVSNQSQVLPCDPAKPLRFEVEGTSGEKDDKSIACHSFRVRKQEQHYPYPSVPHLRRKKVPWSNAEEEALKEGVRRFASNHDRNMPWKKILEFGAEIFEKHRTAIDLKDKWRNICKGSPKV